MTNLRITIPSAVYNAIFRTTHLDRSRQAEAAASAAVRAVAEDLRSSADGVDVTDDYDAGWKRALSVSATELEALAKEIEEIQ